LRRHQLRGFKIQSHRHRLAGKNATRIGSIASSHSGVRERRS